jgi:two-component system, OmpR family, copper resistance phosphate regulon response regulator CusR
VRRILVVEDEVKVARALCEGLATAGYEAVPCTDGAAGYAMVSSSVFDAVVLDLMLPGRTGLEILAALRARGTTPVLVLTARDTIEDRVIGLDAGADDYLVKPFAFAELLARVRALLRRGRPEAPLRLVIGDLTIDRKTRAVTRAGRSIELTVREYEVLEYLVQHKGEVVSREMLTRDVWKESMRATSLDNVIDVHIARLRKKVDHDHAARLIQTVRGVGFIVQDQGS